MAEKPAWDDRLLEWMQRKPTAVRHGPVTRGEVVITAIALVGLVVASVVQGHVAVLGFVFAAVWTAGLATRHVRSWRRS